MAGRYPPPHDSRYTPRERSRSPTRFPDRRFSAGFQSQIPPAGPRSELRNAPPLGTANRERPFRERDFDRRPRPPSPPRPRSPPRPFRDAPAPRDIDNNRVAPSARDGPPSAGPGFAEPPPAFQGPPFSRGAFSGRGRGRGRGDFDSRDRARRPGFDDRNTFRPRERSPPPRWGREPPRSNEREDWRPERHEEDRWSERDDRERDGDRFRRDAPAPRFDRSVNDQTPRSPGPLQPPQRSQTPASERPSFDTPRDDVPQRRASATAGFPQPPKDQRPLPPQNELMAGRAEASNTRFGGRSSPPPQAPSVPAFGTISFKRPSLASPSSNAWKPQPEAKRSPSPPPPQQQQQQSKPPSPSIPQRPVPTAPRAQIGGPPPAAPKAFRGIDAPSTASNQGPAGLPAPRTLTQGSPSIPTAPAALRNEDRSSVPQSPVLPRGPRQSFGQSTSSIPHVPTSPRGLGRPPVAPRGASVERLPMQQTISRKPSDTSLSSEGRTASRFEPPPSRIEPQMPVAPSGPRSTSVSSTSPNLTSSSVPTAPKADRAIPTAPRAPGDRMPASAVRPAERVPVNAIRAPTGNFMGAFSNQWIRPNPLAHRDSLVPAKRDVSGEEKQQPSSLRSNEPTQKPAPMNNAGFRSLERDVRSYNATSKPPVQDDPISRMQDRTPPLTTAQGPNLNRKPKIDDVGDQVEPSLSDSSSDDDGMDLDEEDFESTKAKFEKQKAHLQSQLIDLSGRQYRGTTPLEQIARLAKITTDDLPPLDELSPLGDAPSLGDEEESRSVSEEGSGDQELLTPKEEEPEADDVVVDGSDSLDHILPPPPRRKTPEVINLPFLIKSPLTPMPEQQAYRQHAANQEASRAAVVAHLNAKREESDSLSEDMLAQYAEAYRAYRQFSLKYDDEREERERAEMEKSADVSPEVDAALNLMEAPMDGNSRRLHKFSSEYDIQKVLKESEETARIEQEKLDREAKKARDDMEKEAAIPELWSDEMRTRRLFKDTNHFRSPARLTEIYGYRPPPDDFSEEEQKIFLDAFREKPKKWGEIAKLLPGRTYQHCIHHYYAFKWDGRFRETKGKRKPRVARGRGGKGVTRVRGAALMADLGRLDDEAGPITTGGEASGNASGRPKRAATRTQYGEKGEKELEPKPLGTTPGPSVKRTQVKQDGNGEPGQEKPPKRRKAAPGEKTSKKSRPQPLASAPPVSPVKMEREPLSRPIEPVRDDDVRMEEASLLASMQVHQSRIPQPEVNIAALPTESSFSQTMPSEVIDRSRPSTQTAAQRSSASSYWSVPEQQDFLKFIAHFGTDFGAIAAHMGTKTQTMVKNYYQRRADELVEVATQANAKRERGEDMGVPPTPTPIVKRRYDNLQPTAPRTLAPHGELVEGEDMASISSSAAPFASSRLAFATQPGSMATSQQRTLSNPSQAALAPSNSKQQNAPARPSQPPGPKMGFFSESRTEHRPPPRPFAPARPVLPPQSLSEEQARKIQAAQNPHSDYLRSLVEEQERAIKLQEEDRMSRDRVPLATGHLGFGGLQGKADDKPAYENRASTPTFSALPGARSSSLRNILGSPTPSASVPQGPLHSGFSHSTHPSPPKTVGFRPSSVPAGAVTQPPPSKLAAPPEPRKTSNLASLLNSEPEEPRPRNRMSDHSVQSVVSRVPSPGIGRNATPVNHSVPPQQRRETFGQSAGPHRSIFDRQPLPPSQAPTPTPKQEPGHWSSLPSASRSREEWMSRPGLPQSQQSGSPRQPTIDREPRPFYSSHRASAFGSMDGQARVNPSPPPHAHPGYGHSRNPSYNPTTQSGPGTQSGSQSASQHPQTRDQQQAGQILQPNPYAQPPGPAPHLQHLQQGHMQGSSIEQRHPGMHSRQISREDDMARDHERAYRDRFEMERREREAQYHQQQEQQQQQQQHRYGAPPRPQPLHAPVHPASQPSYPPERPQSAYPSEHHRLSLREQAEREGQAIFRQERERMEHERKEQDMIMMRRREQQERESDEGKRRFEDQLRATGAFVPRSSQGPGFPRRR